MIIRHQIITNNAKSIGWLYEIFGDDSIDCLIYFLSQLIWSFHEYLLIIHSKLFDYKVIIVIIWVLIICYYRGSFLIMIFCDRLTPIFWFIFNDSIICWFCLIEQHNYLHCFIKHVLM